MKIRLHLGAHKTASTHFEKLLTVNDALLRSHSTFYATKDLYHDALMRSIWSIQKGKDPDPEWAQKKANLVAQRDVVFMSAENFLGGTHRLFFEGELYPAMTKILSRALDMLEPESLSIMICVRDFVGFLPSAWTEATRFHSAGEFRQYVADLTPSVTWTSVVERIRDLVPEAPLTVWDFRAYRRDSNKFVPLAMGLPYGADIPVEPFDEVVRPGPSARALQEIARLRARLDRETWRDEVDAIVEKFPKSDRFPGVRPWNLDEQDELMQWFEEDLARIEAMSGVTLIR